MYQDKIVSISIAANNTIEGGDGNVPERCIYFDDRRIRVDLDARTDIYDTNAIRYQIKDNKEMANFFDKFVIVTCRKKEKAYQKYESQKRARSCFAEKTTRTGRSGLLKEKPNKMPLRKLPQSRQNGRKA